MELTDLLLERLAGRECRRCGRRLTDPDSIDEGIGPICKKHDNHELVIGWAELRMPRGLSGMADAKRIAEIGFEHFSNWEIVEIIKVVERDDTWYAFAPDRAMSLAAPSRQIVIDSNTRLIGMRSSSATAGIEMCDLLEEELPNGTKIKYECVHQDAEWLSTEYNYEGPTEDLWKGYPCEWGVSTPYDYNTI